MTQSITPQQAHQPAPIRLNDVKREQGTWRRMYELLPPGTFVIVSAQSCGTAQHMFVTDGTYEGSEQARELAEYRAVENKAMIEKQREQEKAARDYKRKINKITLATAKEEAKHNVHNQYGAALNAPVTALKQQIGNKRKREAEMDEADEIIAEYIPQGGAKINQLRVPDHPLPSPKTTPSVTLPAAQTTPSVTLPAAQATSLEEEK